MRRSSSTSHIPTFKRASSSDRASGFAYGQLRRTGSSDHIAVSKNKRSGSLHLQTHLRLPSVTPLAKQRASGLTPSSTASTGRRSPFKSTSKSERIAQTNDKKWVQEQYIKVRRYLQSKNVDPNIKPPTISIFTEVTDFLFTTIDQRLHVTMANYKEKVPQTLKCLEYPLTVSNSLMKTVNTMHAWPQLISIWSYLVDLITFIQSYGITDPSVYENEKYRMIECLKEYLCKKYLTYGANEEAANKADEWFQEKFADVLKIDPTHNVNLRQEIEELNGHIATNSSVLSRMEKENKKTELKLQKLQEEIDVFNMQDRQIEEENKELIATHTKNISEKEDAIKEKKQSVKDLRIRIKNQECSYNQYKDLNSRIEAMRQTNTLARGMLETRKKIRADYDFKLVESQRRVEKEVYRLNRDLLELEIIDPSLSGLELRRSGFFALDFKDEVDKLVTNVSAIKNENAKEIKQIEEQIAAVKANLNVLDKNVIATTHTLEELNACKQHIEEEIQRRKEEGEIMCQEAQMKFEAVWNEIQELSGSEPDVETAKIKAEELTTRSQKLHEEFDRMQVASVKFLNDYYVNAMSHLQKMNEIFEKVNGQQHIYYDHAIDQLNKLNISLQSLEPYTEIVIE